ncbi:efflux RND transporter permease subunit [Paracraurococcus lichenis]|uniref:CusA/CzcA family heavy metal efflux RND transporter n=1 Tax=Paracraurococcus lichenis TaxID=3064888 RepID=A0ABT9E7Y5_9PROT|nr:CusA/CzcA family heavy metal efflux RND transporter [Paracraurococcus sp. LOR1-02]MDO9712175.1 CusA/CzcA family heavy metal efflux RND transporter [Paracraurococcus sp. LOR1-02]
MRSLVAFALQKRALVILLFVAFLGMGFAGFRQLNIEAYPDPVPPTVVVITQNPGQSAEEIERYITIPIEVGLSGMPNLAKVRSTSLFGLSVVSAQFTFAYNYEQSLQQVLNRLGQIQLPNGVQPQISPWSPIGEILRYRIVGPPGFSLTDLRVLQDWVLQRRFKRVPGVIDVTAYGGPTKSYNVVIDLPKLTAYGLSLPQVVEAIGNGDATTGAGIVDVGPQSAVVQGVGLIRSMDDVRNTVIGANNNMPILVSDVARVEVGNLPRLGIAGQEADDDVVMGVVLMRRGEQTLPTIRAVEQEVQAVNAGGVLPPGVKIVPIYDRKDLVEVTTHHVVKNIIMGIALVVFIQWLFLGDLRGAIVVGATIPFAFFTAVIVMLLRGESANLLSLGSLDFGLLVDATVIMVENVYRHLHLTHAAHGHRIVHPTASRGLSGVPLIVHRAAGEVSTAIFFSALIIVAAFIPLFTMGGIEGRIFGPMAKTYAYAIGGALFATFTVAPALAGALFRDETTEKVMPIVRWMGRAHLYLHHLAMRRRFATILVSGLLLSGAVFQFTRMGGEFLPTLEEGSIWMRATMPATISLDEGNRYVNRMRLVLQEFPEVITITSQQGRPDDGTDSAGFFNAEFFVPLKPMDEWTTAKTKDELIGKIQARLNQEFIGVDFNFSQYISDNVQEASSGVKGANALKVIGPELDVLARVAEQIRQQMEKVEGIADLAAFRTLGQPTVSIRIDRARAARYGLAVSDINQVIQAAIGGQEAARLYEEGGDRNFPIIVRLDAPYRIGLDAIRRIPVSQQSGATLGDVASIRLVTGASYIYREDASRYVPVKFSVRGRDPQSAVEEAMARVEQNVTLPPGYKLEWVGEFRNLQDAIARLKIVVPIALALIGVLLYVQFSSLRDTLLIFALLPLSCIGGVAALDAMELHFSVPAAIGFLALFGITVMEGIILLSHFHGLRDAGMPWRQALDQAGVDRMRPVMMTCLAAMVGLLPAAVATGIGSDLQKPLAVVVVGGTTLLPAFILVVFPAMIDLFGKPASLRRRAPRGATVGAR